MVVGAAFDLSGNPISQVIVGQVFNLQFEAQSGNVLDTAFYGYLYVFGYGYLFMSAGVAELDGYYFNSPGNETVEFYDYNDAKYGNFSITVLPAPVDHFAITPVNQTGAAISAIVAEMPATFNVTALDRYGHVVAGYNGTVDLSTGDGQSFLNGSGLPIATLTLRAGAGSFSAILDRPDTTTIAATDASNSALTGSDTITIQSALSGMGVDIQATAGEAFSGLIATFIDQLANAQARTFVASIAWGDGTTSAGTIAPNANGGFNVTGTQTYAAAGSYPIGVTITNTVGDALTLTSHGAWAAAATMPLTRNTFSAVTGADGRIYVVGGYDQLGNQISAVEAYNAENNTWTTVTNLPAPGSEFAVAAGSDGRIYVFGGYDASYNNVSDQAEAYDPASNSWTTLAPLPTPLVDEAAVAGPDGRIYVLGGYDGDFNVSAGVEVYDPTHNTWSSGANMPAGRVYLSAVLGGDGKIYALGGYSQDLRGSDSAVDAYDPAADTWTSDVTNLPVSPYGFAATAGRDGRIYVVGGYDATGNVTAQSEVYDPPAGTWTTLPAMSTPRDYLAAAALPDGRVFALGGYDGNALNTVEDLTDFSGMATVFGVALTGLGLDIQATAGVSFSGLVATFNDQNKGAQAGDFQASIAWGDGTISAGTVTANAEGGFDVAGTQTYAVAGSYPIGVTVTDTVGDLLTLTATGAWAKAAALPNQRILDSAVTGADGRIYVLGGYDLQLNLNSAVDAYNPGSDTWTTVTNLPPQGPLVEFAVAVGRDGRIYVFGGLDASGICNLAEAYDPLSNLWTTLAPLPAPLADAAAVTGPDGRIYVLGGVTGPDLGTSSVSAGVEIYDPAQNTWSRGADMPAGRQYPSAVLAGDGKIYVLGGGTPGHVVGSSDENLSVDAYDPASDTWTSDVTDVVAAQPVGFAATAGNDGRIYVVSGYDANGNWDPRSEVYDPTTHTWTTLPAIISALPQYRAATALPDGRVFAVGTYDVQQLTDFSGTATVTASQEPAVVTFQAVADSGTLSQASGTVTVQYVDGSGDAALAVLSSANDFTDPNVSVLVGSTVTFDASSSGSGPSERWQYNSNGDQPTFVVSGDATLSAGYFDQQYVSFQASTTPGGTPLSAGNDVTASYTQFGGGVRSSGFYDGTSFSAWADVGSNVAFDAQSSAPSSSERWQYDAKGDQPTFVVGSNGSPFTAIYYDQQYVTFAAVTANGTPMSATNDVTASYSQFTSGLRSSGFYDGTSFSDWADAGSQVAFDSQSSASNANESWRVKPGEQTVFTAGSDPSPFVVTYNYSAFVPFTISGQVYLDFNHNGSLDVGEPGLSGWTVDLFLNGGSSPIATAVSNGSGAYSFSGLGAGSYQVHEEPQPGWTQTSAIPAPIVGASGVDVGNQNFGDHQTTPPAVVPAATKDNGQLLYNETGLWSTVAAGGWNNSYRVVNTNGSGTGSRSARWTMRVAPGEYEVYVTYPAAPQNASSVPYSIVVGGQTITVYHNQQQTPDDAVYGGVLWASLGVFDFTGTSIVNVVVQVTDAGTNGWLVADGAMLASYSGGTPQVAEAAPPTGESKVMPLTAAELQPVVTEAKTLLSALGLNPQQQAALDAAQTFITALPPGFLGTTSGEYVYLDATADGWGWYVGWAPYENSFAPSGGEWRAVAGSPAAGHIDLLTVVTHELGHVIGLEDVSNLDQPGNVMDVLLSAGERRLPQPGESLGQPAAANLAAPNTSIQGTGASGAASRLIDLVFGGNDLPWLEAIVDERSTAIALIRGDPIAAPSKRSGMLQPGEHELS